METPPPDDPGEFTEWLLNLPEHDFEQTVSQMTVAEPVSVFVECIWGQHDLTAAWRLVDPLLRACWTQHWLYANRAEPACEGLVLHDIVEAFGADVVNHELWEDFERVQLGAFAQWDDLTTWGTGTATRLLGPGIEVVCRFPPGVKVFAAGSHQWVYNFIMRHDESAGWRILNLFSDSVIPEPGWPPRLY